MKEKVINILYDSFYENKSVNYVIKQSRKNKSLKVLLSFSFNEGMRFGKVFLNDTEDACAIIIDSSKRNFSLVGILDKINLVLFSFGIGNLLKVVRRENLIKQRHPKGRYIHLWYIGVSKDSQKTGKGSILLKKIISEYSGVPIYLETTTEEYSHFYEKHGFVKSETLELDHDLMFYVNPNTTK